MSLVLHFDYGFVLFEGSIASDAAEVTLKGETAALFAFERASGLVVGVAVLTLARGSPLVDIESLSPGQVPQTQLFRSPGDEEELLACTVIALGVGLLLGNFLGMRFVQMSTKAPGL